jgi:hypothetical protein
MEKTYIEIAVENAKAHEGSIICPVCGEELYSLMDKISIYLYGKCPNELSDTETENLLNISDALI